MKTSLDTPKKSTIVIYKEKKDNFNYNLICTKLIRYLWLLILMPKEIQFISLVISLILLSYSKKKICLEREVRPLLLIGIVQMISIFIQIFLGNYDSLNRIFGAFNTASLWILIPFFYSCIKNNGNSQTRKDVGKSCFINICVLFVFALIFIVFGNVSLNYGLSTRSVSRVDWINDFKTFRFVGFLEYPTLVGLLILISMPYAFFYIKSLINKPIYVVAEFIFMAISFWIILMSHTRASIVLALVQIYFLFVYCLIDITSKKNKNKMVNAIIAISIILFVFTLPFIGKGFDFLLTARGGSTRTRMNIYRTSIDLTLNNSPIIGMGIKNMLGRYPLGSHSTVIGIFYKTGIIGFGLLMVSLKRFFDLNIDLFKKTKNHQYKFVVIALCVLIAFCSFLTEDIDGTDWLMLVYFVLLATTFIPKNRYAAKQTK